MVTNKHYFTTNFLTVSRSSAAFPRGLDQRKGLRRRECLCVEQLVPSSCISDVLRTKAVLHSGYWKFDSWSTSHGYCMAHPPQPQRGALTWGTGAQRFSAVPSNRCSFQLVGLRFQRGGVPRCRTVEPTHQHMSKPMSSIVVTV